MEIPALFSSVNPTNNSHDEQVVAIIWLRGEVLLPL